jgi:FtsP/CotA-like multicopper oxidase with cupredoxin domain
MKRLLLLTLAGLLMGVYAPGNAIAAFYSQCPPDMDGIDTDQDGDPNNDHVCYKLSAGDGFVTMADGRPLYMFGFGDVTAVPDEHIMMMGMLEAEFPAPLIKAREGQKLFISLHNVGMLIRPDLFDPHTVHFHGFANAAPVFDGVPDASISVNMNATLTYYYNIVDAGTYMYHCHVEASEHMQMGMLGNLYITPIQDGQQFEYPVGSGRFYTQFAYNDGDGSTGYDVDYPIQVGTFDPEFHDASYTVQPLPFANMHDTYAMLNGRGYPETVDPLALSTDLTDLAGVERSTESQPMNSLIVAEQGQRILLRLSSLSTTEFITLTAQGLRMKVVGKGARILRSSTGQNLYYNTNSVTLGGGESADVIVDTKGIPVGTYFLYTTNMNFLSNNTEDFGGIMTEIRILPEGGAR